MPTLNGMDAELRQRTEWMLWMGNGKMALSSGFRSSAEQQAQYDLAVREHGVLLATRYAAKPGTSDHERGKAVDIACAVMHRAERERLAKECGLEAPLPHEPWHFKLAPKRTPLPKPKADPGVDSMLSYITIPCSTGGYWELRTDNGGVDAYDGAPFFGSLPSIKVKPLAAIVSLTPLMQDDMVAGYWLCGMDGGVFAFGAAQFLGAYAGHPSWHTPGAFITGLVQSGGFESTDPQRYKQIRREPNKPASDISEYNFPLGAS